MYRAAITSYSEAVEDCPRFQKSKEKPSQEKAENLVAATRQLEKFKIVLKKKYASLVQKREDSMKVMNDIR